MTSVKGPFSSFFSHEEPARRLAGNSNDRKLAKIEESCSKYGLY